MALSAPPGFGKTSAVVDWLPADVAGTAPRSTEQAEPPNLSEMSSRSETGTAHVAGVVALGMGSDADVPVAQTNAPAPSAARVSQPTNHHRAPAKAMRQTQIARRSEKNSLRLVERHEPPRRPRH